MENGEGRYLGSSETVSEGAIRDLTDFAFPNIHNRLVQVVRNH